MQICAYKMLWSVSERSSPTLLLPDGGFHPTVGLFWREGQRFHAELRVCGWMGVPNNKDSSKQAGEHS